MSSQPQPLPEGNTRRAEPPKLERDILAEVLIAVTALPGAFFIRSNTGTARTESGRVVRFGRPGQPDVVGCFRGHYVGIETKTRTGRQSRDQKLWQENVERSGGVYILARSVGDVLSRLEAL